ncbi:MAG: NAD(P)H-dependent glycerol-3-phosphate dehydrogenase [bacterium]
MKIGVLGAGSWGIALSRVLQENGHNICLWEFDAEAFKILEQKREAADKLPGIKIPDSILISNNLETVLHGTDALVIAVPSHTLRGVASSLNRYQLKNKLIINVSKGIENNTLLTLSQVFKEVCNNFTQTNYTALCGPSHAEEVSQKLPTTVVSAASDIGTAEAVQKLFSCAYLRVYTNHDLLGVEISSALKNVIAIAAGISDGLGYGDNAKGALLTRGIVEMSRLVKAMGGDKQTCFGLSGIGDLIATCTSRHSRNRYVGEKIGKGIKLSDILSGMSMVAEGVNTTRSAYDLAIRNGIEMPITEQVYLVLFKEKSPLLAVKELMTREFKAEVS